ncbi:phasin family protein [Thalassospira profundimaris]|nr:phasin family protein [Thalassospira profundimaris]
MSSVASGQVSKSTTGTASTGAELPAKRVVMTSSEIEAAAKQVDDAPVPKSDAVVEDVSTPKNAPVTAKDGASVSGTTIDEAGAPAPAPVKLTENAPSVPEPAVKATPSKVAASKVTSATKKVAPVTAVPKSSSRPASKPAVVQAKSDVKPEPVATATAASSSKPVTSSETERASTVTTTSKSATETKKATASTTPKKATAPKKVPAEAPSVAKSASKSAEKPVASKEEAPKQASKPAAPKGDDLFGFGQMFMAPDAMESYLELWKAPEIDAIVEAGNDALEESVAVANDAFAKLFDAMTGQSDVISDAGSRIAAQCEELVDMHQKNLEETWLASRTVFEKTGGIGAELAAWMQREIEASQDDLDALTKAESLSDIQELQSKILTRYVESSVAEGEKIQEIMFSAMSDSFNAMSKAASAVMK